MPDEFSTTLDEISMEVESIVTNEIANVFSGSLRPTLSLFPPSSLLTLS